MYAPFDPASAQAVSDRITPAHVRDILEGYVRAEVIPPEEGRAIAAELDALLALIRGPLTGEPFWRAFQQQFGFARAAERIVPMNAANLCPEPDALINAANRLRTAYNVNVAQQVRTAGGERVLQMQNVRRRLAQSLGLRDADDLALIRNSSEGNNAISCGYRGWRQVAGELPRDKVVVWSQNHPTNLEAWRLRRDWHTGCRGDDKCPRPGDPFRLVVITLATTATVDEIVEAFTEEIDENTRFVSYSDVSNGNGMRIPEAAVARIWAHAQRFPDCHVHIDGTMSWGARRVDLGNAHCHSFVSSAHKWFLGPKETAIFHMHKDKVCNFTPGIFAYDYAIRIHDWDLMPVNALRFELLGQRDDVNLLTLDLTQLVWDALARRDPHGRVLHLATRLMDALRSPPGWTLMTPDRPGFHLGIVRVEAPRKTTPGTPSLYDWMYARERRYRFGGSGGSEKPGEQTFRLCPHLYNTEDDIDRAVASMNEWRVRHGA